jgi:hypothetical protein
VIIRAFFAFKKLLYKNFGEFFHPKKKNKTKAKVVEFTLKKHLLGKNFPNFFLKNIVL